MEEAGLNCGCGDNYCSAPPKYVLSRKDFTEKGKMSSDVVIDFVIDVNMLSSEEFLKKHC